MLKPIVCMRRKAGMSQETFEAYWRDHHGPLVRRHADTLRIRRYAQLHPAPEGLSEAIRSARGIPGRYDGMAELWFDSADDLKATAEDPAAQRARAEIAADEVEFMDLEGSALPMATEDVFKEAD